MGNAGEEILAVIRKGTAAGEEILAVIRNHRCGIHGAEEAHTWPEFQALVARIKASEENCEAEAEAA